MHESPTKSSTPDLDYPFGDRSDLQSMDWVSAVLAFFVGMALQNWVPWTVEGLTFRSSVLIAAIGAFVLSRFMLSGHKGWMIGLLSSAVVISAVTAIVLI